MNIKAVIFDIDGTLYPNWKMYLFSLPFFCLHPRLMISFGKIRKEIRRIRPIDDFYLLQGALLGKEMGIIPEKAGELIQKLLYTDWQDIFAHISPFEGIPEVLGKLKEKGKKIALLSDFPIYPKLSRLGLNGYWDAEISTEDVGYLKPNPEPFMAAAAAVSCEPGECLYVGNHYHYDILGAGKAGMKTAHLTGRISDNSLADFSFSSYNEFITKFENLDN